MAIIPSNEQFIGLSASLNTTEKRSALVNAESQAYTMQDIVDTVEDALPPAVNPTSGYYPINKNGVFVNSGLSNTVASLPPFLPGGSLGLKYYDDFQGKTLLELNPMDLSYTFGNAFYDEFGVVASGGIAISQPMGQMVIGCGISSGANGVFRASGVQGFISIGNTPSTSIGVNMFSQSVRIGSGLMFATPPVDPVNAAQWVTVNDESGNSFRMPLYQ